MKQTLLVAVASAAIGAATAVLLIEKPVSVGRASARAQTLDTQALEAAFRRALASVRIEMRGETTSSTREPTQETTSADKDSPPADGARDADDAALLSPPRLTVLGSLRPFTNDDTLRRTWMFRTERDVLKWLGTPHQVHGGQGTEFWQYDLVNPPGKVSLRFHRGRLISLTR